MTVAESLPVWHDTIISILLDVMGPGIKEQPHWYMLFADDIVLCSCLLEEIMRKGRSRDGALEERGDWQNED